MTAQSLVYDHARRLRGEAPCVRVPDPACWLCGEPTHGHGVPRAERITPAFSQGTEARAPRSGSLCVPCAWSLAGKPGEVPTPPRMLGHLASPAVWRNPTRGQWRDELLALPSLAPPFAVCIPTSGQKHLLYKTPLNWGVESLMLRFEELLVHVHLADLLALIANVDALLRGGFSKAEVETGRYSQNRVRTIGLRAWQGLEAALRPRRNTPPFLLALYVARKESA